MDREWKLGIDLHEQDNILDGFTFEQIITALHCNEQVVDEKSVKKTIKEMLEVCLQDLDFLTENNIQEIIARAKDGR